MKTSKLILYSILLFVISSFGVTYWYISNHLLSNISNLQVQSVIDIYIQIGIIAGLIPSISFMLYSIIIKDIRSRIVQILSVFVLIIVDIIILYYFILYMTFHEFKNPILFQ